MELSSLALAYVYFERLVLRSEVAKENRRALAAGCMLLALKFNDRRCFDQPRSIPPFAAALEKRLDVSVKGIAFTYCVFFLLLFRCTCFF